MAMVAIRNMVPKSITGGIKKEENTNQLKHLANGYFHPN
jgi:hypothetical protein